VTRGRDLREETVDGRIEVQLGGLPIGQATAKITGGVLEGQLTATVEAEYTFAGLGSKRLHRALDPVPVPTGQALNPLQPVNRIADLRPGRRWLVHESDPLKEAVALLLKDQAGAFGFKLPTANRDPLVGEVLSEEQTLDWHGRPISCWVIEYRRDVLVARTWIRASDGKVLQQEAFEKGEILTLIRDE